MQAIKARASQQARKLDTRRKILVGSLMLSRIRGENKEAVRLRAWLSRELRGFLTRGVDSRALAELLTDAATN